MPSLRSILCMGLGGCQRVALALITAHVPCPSESEGLGGSQAVVQQAVAETRTFALGRKNRDCYVSHCSVLAVSPKE
jgi:hypothetical protein